MAKKTTKAKKTSKKKSKPRAAKAEPAAEPDPYGDSFGGALKERRFGLRVDDDVIVYIVGGDILRVVQGRVLEHKKGLHLVDEEGYYHRISYDWVTDIIVLQHNRPLPGDDPEYKRKSPSPRAKTPKAQQSPPTDQAYQ